MYDFSRRAGLPVVATSAPLWYPYPTDSIRLWLMIGRSVENLLSACIMLRQRKKVVCVLRRKHRPARVPYLPRVSLIEGPKFDLALLSHENCQYRGTVKSSLFVHIRAKHTAGRRKARSAHCVRLHKLRNEMEHSHSHQGETFCLQPLRIWNRACELSSKSHQADTRGGCDLNVWLCCCEYSSRQKQKLKRHGISRSLDTWIHWSRALLPVVFLAVNTVA